MKTALIIAVVLVINGCSTVPFDVHLLSIDEVRSPENCGRDILPNFGCWRPISLAGGCKVMVEKPRHSGDTARLATLGKEVWKCLTGNKEY